MCREEFGSGARGRLSFPAIILLSYYFSKIIVVLRVDFLRLACAGVCALEQFDAIGCLVRASPFKILILVLDLTIAVNDFAMPVHLT